MARLQILELPKGDGDDRPPFILVIDEVADEETERIIGSQEATDGLVKKVGARAVAVFHGMTVDIPANNSTVYSEASELAESVRADERAIQAEEKLKAFMDKRYEIEEKRKASLTDALGLDRLRDWDDILNAAAGLRKNRDALAAAVERVRAEPTEPDVMNAQQERSDIWLHGYKCGVLAARSAARAEREQAVGDGG